MSARTSVSPMSAAPAARAAELADEAAARKRRSFWLKQLHQWHWISSAICLIAMLLFAFTGITLNHAGQIGAEPKVVMKEAQLPATLARELAEAQAGGQDKAPLPAAVRGWIDAHMSLAVDPAAQAEWSGDEVYVSLPRPGGDAWASIALPGGKIHYEVTRRGWIAYLNDLHKGRNTGDAWKWFLDVFAVACLVFCLTGLLLLKMHARHRPITWPVVGLGLFIPVVLALIFIH